MEPEAGEQDLLSEMSSKGVVTLKQSQAAHANCLLGFAEIHVRLAHDTDGHRIASWVAPIKLIDGVAGPVQCGDDVVLMLADRCTTSRCSTAAFGRWCSKIATGLLLSHALVKAFAKVAVAGDHVLHAGDAQVAGMRHVQLRGWSTECCSTSAPAYGTATGAGL